MDTDVSEPVSLSSERAKRDGTAAEFRQFIAFPDDRDGFVEGYEMGCLFARLDAKPEQWSGTYHAGNAEMIRRTAAACGYEVEIESSGDAAWVFVTFTRRTLEVVR
ncbi:MAG: hypothetical protein WC718_16310 [Phycisphaerales bacterium]|jgi:hypothetical protein